MLIRKIKKWHTIVSIACLFHSGMHYALADYSALSLIRVPKLSAHVCSLDTLTYQSDGNTDFDPNAHLVVHFGHIQLTKRFIVINPDSLSINSQRQEIIRKLNMENMNNISESESPYENNMGAISSIFSKAKISLNIHLARFYARFFIMCFYLANDAINKAYDKLIIDITISIFHIRFLISNLRSIDAIDAFYRNVSYFLVKYGILPSPGKSGQIQTTMTIGANIAQLL